MVRSVGDYLVLILSIVGSLASIVAFGIYFGPSLNDQGWVGVLFLGIISITFMVYNFYLILKYRKKIRYSKVFNDINIGFAELHSIDRDNDPSIELIIKKLSSLCDHISDAFSKINGHHIGVCIKFLVYEDQRPLVQTLVRDSHSKSNDRKTGTADKTKHYIDKNSDFNFIYSNFDDDNIDTSFYYEAKLPICKDYQNTRLSNNWMSGTKLPILENFIRRKSWPLKYRSTLVTPIVPLLADEQNIKSLRGYLCIDSPKEKSFFKEVDVSILKGISDGLYNKIDKLHQLLKNKPKN